MEAVNATSHLADATSEAVSHRFALSLCGAVITV
jgi:hypothetical protein